MQRVLAAAGVGVTRDRVDDDRGVRIEARPCGRGGVAGVDVDGERDVGVAHDAVEMQVEQSLVVRVADERHGQDRECADPGIRAHGRAGVGQGASVR